MHSPEVLAFHIRSPFPTRMNKKKLPPEAQQWKSPFYWSKGRGLRFSPFMHLAGREFHFEDIAMIWHIEPGGKDALTVCERRWKDAEGKWHYSKAWRWHIWHWQVSPSLLYKWRRRLFTRCAYCGGPSRKGSVVNVSDGGWDGAPKTPLWCGEIQLYHSKCHAIISNNRHRHDPRGCYGCSGKASFEFNRRQRNGSRELAKRLFGGDHGKS